MKVTDYLLRERLFRTTVAPTVWEDVSPNRLAATPTDLTYTDLPSGIQLPTFNGSSSRVAVTNTDAVLAPMAFTIECWVYTNVLNASGTSGNIVAMWTGGGTPAGINFQIWDKSMRVGVGDGAGVQVNTTGTGDITISTWHRLAVTFSRPNMIYYIDNTAQTLAYNVDMGKTGATFYIGCYNAIGSWWNGYIWNMRMFPYVKTAAQLYGDYQNERGWLSV